MHTTSSTPALARSTPGVEAFTPVQLLRLTQLFASDPALADTLGPDPDRPGERSWRLLADSPRLQVWLIRWPVGTGTGWHDHGGARGGFTVVRGNLTEQTRERSVVATELDLRREFRAVWSGSAQPPAGPARDLVGIARQHPG